MKRRVLLGRVTVVGSLIFGAEGRAQRTVTPVIGYLGTAVRDGRPDILPEFYDGLKEAGYVIGRNVALDYRSVEGRYERMPRLAAELVALRVSVLVAPNIQAALTARTSTTAIPIAFHSGVDPVALGLVDSLPRPGGNATGIYSYTSGLVAKRVELVRDLMPNARSLAFLVNPGFAAAPYQVRDMKEAVGTTGLALRIVEVRSADELDGVFAGFADQRPDAILVAPDSLFTTLRDRIILLAARYAIATVYDFPDYPAAGGLISYGPVRRDVQRMLAVYVGRILGGTKPADLPVQQPTKYELVVNLRTAKSLGLTIPPSLLARADEVIE